MITPFEKIKSNLGGILPKDLLDRIPRKWEKIGDVLILKLSRELKNYEKDIARVYANVLSCKTVLNDIGGIRGVERIPVVEYIYGSKDTETIHIENGIRFMLDPMRIMFSSGNIDERIRISTISNPKEVVVDLFAGIGYFTIPIAVYSKPKKIYAYEINPIAYHYLCKNIVLNHVTDIVKPILGDNREKTIEDIADRVIMGYFGDTYKFISTAIKCLRNHKGFIHYHDVFPEEYIPDKPLYYLTEQAEMFNRKVEMIRYRRVKSYAPGINHYVFDVKIW